MERLIRAIPQEKWSLVKRFSPETWRRLMSAGKTGRLRARIGAMAAFPMQAIASAGTNEVRVVVPTTNPFYLPFALVITQALHGCIVVPLIYDLYPDAVEAAGLSRKEGLTSKITAWMNKYTFKNADAVVFIGRNMARHAQARYGRPKKVEIVDLF